MDKILCLWKGVCFVTGLNVVNSEMSHICSERFRMEISNVKDVDEFFVLLQKHKFSMRDLEGIMRDQK